MLTEDYLIRMINLAISALLQILGLKEAGSYQDALALIDLTFERLLGLNARIAKNLDDERLYYLITNSGRLDTRRLAIIAELFYHEGDIYAAQGREEESRRDYARALKYFLEVFFQRPDPEPEGLVEKIEWLAEAVPADALGPDTLWPLSNYYEAAGKYARAEAALLALVEQPEAREAVLPELVDFYTRLQGKPASQLEAGGLAQEQVRAALERWKQQ